MCTCTWAMVCMEVRGQLAESVLCHVGPGGWTQIIRLSSKLLYLLSHLVQCLPQMFVTPYAVTKIPQAGWLKRQKFSLGVQKAESGHRWIHSSWGSWGRIWWLGRPRRLCVAVWSWTLLLCHPHKHMSESTWHSLRFPSSFFIFYMHLYVWVPVCESVRVEAWGWCCESLSITLPPYPQRQSLNQTQVIWLVSPTSLLWGSPVSASQGCNYGWAVIVWTPTQHLHRFWGFVLWTLCLHNRHFNHWTNFPDLPDYQILI